MVDDVTQCCILGQVHTVFTKPHVKHRSHDCERFITHQNLKLIFLSTCVTLCGVFMGLVPVAPSFPALLLSKMSSLWQKYL